MNIILGFLIFVLWFFITSVVIITTLVPFIYFGGWGFLISPIVIFIWFRIWLYFMQDNDNVDNYNQQCEDK